MKNRKWLKLLLVLLAIVVLGVVFTLSLKSDSSGSETETTDVIVGTDVVAQTTEADVLVETTETTEMSTTEALACVHVCGEVVNPGVYYLGLDSRVHEAVELAGGLTDNADSDYVNMAQTVSDGQQIYIPSKDEVASGTFRITEDSSAVSADDGLVDINKADLEKLMTLPGIGEAKAQSIISYRNETGFFTSVDDIKNVSGIGDSLFEQIKDKIKV